MKRAMLLYCLSFFSLWCFPSVAISQDAESESEQGQPVPLEKIDPSFLPEKDVTNFDYRFILWYVPETDTWHIRMTTQGWTRNFSGAIRVKHGSIGGCRPIGLEVKKKKAEDQWAINKDRTMLIFKTKTAKYHDGFDFDIKPSGQEEPVVEFDLKIGDKHHPKRVFIGKKQQHPKQIPFGLQAPQRDKKS